MDARNITLKILHRYLDAETGVECQEVLDIDLEKILRERTHQCCSRPTKNTLGHDFLSMKYENGKPFIMGNYPMPDIAPQPAEYKL